MKKIVKGNSIDLLKNLDDNSIDLICTIHHTKLLP